MVHKGRHARHVLRNSKAESDGMNHAVLIDQRALAYSITQ